MIENNENIIQILPDFIANQIAAGEVVQRPESVVKELIENSLDADADTIILAVKNAGKSLIHVVDNGRGMTKNDLLLSVKRHATSKVFKSEDLEEIRTYGFRGEALASVCSVANVEIRTKRKSEEHGYKLVSEPLREEVIEATNCDNGTQIFVRNLFYNVPARRKFLKSNLTEFRYISDTMIKIALSRPDVRFTFYDDDTLIFDVKPSSLKERIISLLGNSVKDSLIEIEYQNEFIKLDGFIGEPHLSRQSRNGQFFFLNKRSIISNSLAHSVYSSYEDLLDKNQKPIFVINIQIDYSKVDVNVHPQKHEVKFDDERFVYNSIKSAVIKALSSHSYIPNTEFSLLTAANPFTTINSENNEKMIINKMTGEVVSTFSFDNNPHSSQSNSIHTSKPQSAFDDIFGRIDNSISEIVIPEIITEYKYFAKRYIVIEVSEYIVIIDQAGFQQRIIYDRTLKSAKVNTKSMQELLFPILIDISPESVVFLSKIHKEIEDIGFRFEIKRNEIVFSSIPDSIIPGNEEETLRRFFSEINSIEINLINDLFDKVCVSYSEAACISNGNEINDAEIRMMLANLKHYKLPIYSPRGKKSVIKLTSQEFYNKLFFSS